MGLTLEQMFPSRFLRAGDFQGKPVTLTIMSVVMDDLEKDDGTERAVAVVSFKETKKQLVLNRTNALSIAAMFGNDTDGWLKRVTFYPERDSSPVNDTGWAIRVKGSPDIAGTIEASIKLPRRRATVRKLLKTTGKQDHQPGLDEETGEVASEPAGRAGYQDIDFANEDRSGTFDDLSS